MLRISANYFDTQSLRVLGSFQAFSRSAVILSVFFEAFSFSSSFSFICVSKAMVLYLYKNLSYLRWRPSSQMNYIIIAKS